MSAEDQKTNDAAGDGGSNKNAGHAPQQRNGNKNKQKKQHHLNKHISGSSFKGEVPELGAITVGSTPSQTKAIFEKTDKALMLRVGREMGDYTLKSLEEEKLVTPEEPEAKMEKGAFVNEMEKMKWQILFKEARDIAQQTEKELQQVFHLYLGQCSDEIKDALKEHRDYEDMKKSKDVFILRKMLKNLTVGFKESKSPIKTLFECLKEFIMIRQMKGESNADYFKRFKNLMKTVSEMIGEDDDNPFIYGYVSLLEQYCKDNNLGDHNLLSKEDQAKYLKMQHGRMEAMHFLLGADEERYGGMIQEFDRAFLSGVDNYPADLLKAYNLLRHWHDNKQQKKKRIVSDTELGVSFNTEGNQDDGGGDDGATKPERKQQCGRCGRYHRGQCTAKVHADGTALHISGTVKEMESIGGKNQVSTCPEPDAPKNDCVVNCSDVMEALIFIQSNTGHSGKGQKKLNTAFSSTLLTMDCGSSVHLISNPDLLINIYESDTTLTVRCNAGVKTTRWRGMLPGLGWVWLLHGGVANILSLSRLKETFRVTYDSALDNSFNVIKKDGSVVKFTEGDNRLYCFDLADRNEESTILITTVDDNKLKFSGHEVAKAEEARKLQQRLGRPSTADLIRYIEQKMIKNCPVTAQDVRNAERILGPDLGSLKGKTPRTKPPPIRVQHVEIPPSIMDHYKDVTLSVDIMKVTKIPFLMSISRHIKFGTASRLETMKNDHILKHFKLIIGTYAIRGFRVTLMLGDNQFESMRGDIADLHAQLHIVARDDHVHEVERFQRTIQERVRAIYNTLPFTHYPPVLIAEMVYSSVFWRNMFPLKNGISDTLSPSELILNRSLDAHVHCKVGMGDYVQTHEEHDNSMDSRTVGAIALRPAAGDGSFYFLNLSTGRRIHRRSWTPLPMPQGVIDQVHRLARRASASRKLTFTNTAGEDLVTLYADLDRDEDDLPLEAETAGVNDDDDDDDDDDSDYEDDGSESTDNSDIDNSDKTDGNYYNVLSGDDEEEDVTEEAEAENEIVGEFPAEVPEVDESEETAGVNDDNASPSDDDEIPGVYEHPDDDDEIPGVYEHPDDDDESPGVANHPESDEENDHPDSEDEEEIPGVGDHPDSEGEEDNDHTNNEEDMEHMRTYNGMNLRNQPKKNYDVFAMASSEVPDGAEMVMLTFNDNSETGIEEIKLDPEDLELAQLTAECMFLTGHLGWKEGLDHNDMPLSEYAFMMEEVTLVTEQMNWKKGLKVFKQQGKEDLAKEAITKELQQIHDMEGFQPVHWYQMTKEERARALNYLMYLKEKRNGIIKGRGCADGRPQRLYTTKMEASSPTVRQASIMLSCMIDAYERRDVATADIPSAFVQTKWPEGETDVHVMLDGEMAMLLAKIDPPTYQKYVHHRRGEPYIYCRLNVALYGTLLAAVLFWKKLTRFLVDCGFVVNPYDWCVVNKMIDGKQCTILWHVDDLKISHVDAEVVSNIIEILQKEYGKVSPLSVTRGKVHEYLGMTLDFSDAGKVIVDMEKYFDEVLQDLPDDMDGVAATPAADHLFKTRDNVPKLDKKRADLFHSKTAQLLYGSQRARPDLRLVVSFLTKRVNAPDEDDYKKLARAIKYIRRTKFLRLTIEAEYLDQNHWFIDGAFAVHDDMKSHTGGYMTFGKGMLDGSSSGQKINTTSSTEAEVVGVHDNMPSLLWTRYFMEAQGYPLKPSVVHQDNQSAMLLETNGRGSSSKRTRHMNIRYFFVGDVMKRKEAILQYCPTDEMIGDFFTKPLGGAKFRRFRNIIMNISHDEHGPVDVDELTAIHYDKMKVRIGESEPMQSIDPGSQECVGNHSEQAKWADEKQPTYADVVSRSDVASRSQTPTSKCKG